MGVGEELTNLQLKQELETTAHTFQRHNPIKVFHKKSKFINL